MGGILSPGVYLVPGGVLSPRVACLPRGGVFPGVACLPGGISAQEGVSAWGCIPDTHLPPPFVQNS